MCIGHDGVGKTLTYQPFCRSGTLVEQPSEEVSGTHLHLHTTLTDSVGDVKIRNNGLVTLGVRQHDVQSVAALQLIEGTLPIVLELSPIVYSGACSSPSLSSLS